jgi:hypothetical protein
VIARRPANCLVALVLLLAGCAANLGRHELDLEVSARGLPGVGVGAALAQRVLDRGSKRIDFELGLERQELADAGPSGDDWTRIWTGLRCGAAEPVDAFVWRAGATWVRSEGEAAGLDPADFGGVYVGGGYAWELAPAFATGPELTVLYLDSEGTGSSGAVAELAWRWVWHL